MGDFTGRKGEGSPEADSNRLEEARHHSVPALAGETWITINALLKVCM